MMDHFIFIYSDGNRYIIKSVPAKSRSEWMGPACRYGREQNTPEARPQRNATLSAMDARIRTLVSVVTDRGVLVDPQKNTWYLPVEIFDSYTEVVELCDTLTKTTSAAHSYIRLSKAVT